MRGPLSLTPPLAESPPAVPLLCMQCEEPAYTNCKDCGFCTPGTAGCTAARNYDGAGRLIGYSRVDGFICNT